MPKDDADQAVDALDVLIEQERSLIAYYEARQAKADTTAAAALTVVLALATLAATSARTAPHRGKAFAAAVVIVLGIAVVVALMVRSVAGLRRNRGAQPTADRAAVAGARMTVRVPFGRRFSSGSPAFDDALDVLREYGSAEAEGGHLKLDPIEARRRILTLCRARAEDAHRAAIAKDRGAAIASLVLAAAVTLTAIFAVTSR
jgi:hypothetical protein